jgi:hypothetical protein
LPEGLGLGPVGIRGGLGAWLGIQCRHVAALSSGFGSHTDCTRM